MEHDGFRIVARKDGDSVHLWSATAGIRRSSSRASARLSRRGNSKASSSMARRAPATKGLARFQRPLGGGAACALACFHAFDLLALDGVDRGPAVLRTLCEAGPDVGGAPEAINLCEHTADYDGNALFEHACRFGLEGIVAKKKAARYRSGTCRSWVKVKNPVRAA